FDANTGGAANFDPQLLVSAHHPRVLTLINALRYFASWTMFRDSIETLCRQDPGLVEFEPTGRRNALVFDRAVARYGHRQMFWYSESSHYTKALGDLVLDRIFHRPNSALPQDFGIELRSDMLERHLALVRARGEQYRNSHPDDIQELARNAAAVVASGVVQPM